MVAIREAFEGILGGPCPEWSWLKASLPSSRGGINLRSAAAHAPAAFIASTTSCKVLVEGILGHSPNISTKLLPLFLLPPLAQTGNSWTTSMCRCSSTTCPWLSTKPSIANYFRPHLQFVPVLSPTPPAFHMRLNGVPSAALGLWLQDKEFRPCLRYWLGIPLHSAPYSCPECHSTADKFGDHQVGCGGNGDRIARHNAIRDVLFVAAQSAALAPSREASGVVPDSLSRPADILLPTWSHGRPAALDVHVISPLQQLTLHEAASTPGHALEVGVQRKLSAYLPAGVQEWIFPQLLQKHWGVWARTLYIWSGRLGI